MLVLEREVGESIVIDGRITITLVAVRRGFPQKVELGIEAPRDMRVDRLEIHERRTASKNGSPR